MVPPSYLPGRGHHGGWMRRINFAWPPPGEATALAGQRGGRLSGRPGKRTAERAERSQIAFIRGARTGRCARPSRRRPGRRRRTRQ